MAAAAQFPKFDTMRGLTPNPAVNTDAHRRGFARAAVAGYLVRWASHVEHESPASNERGKC